MPTEPVEAANVVPASTHLRFHYIKGNYFRVIRVDGALGAPSPTGDIHMAIFSERLPIPIQSIHEMTAAGSVERKPFETIARDGIVREVEADLVMSAPAARAMAAWLLNAAQQAEEIEKSKKGPPQ